MKESKKERKKERKKENHEKARGAKANIFIIGESIKFLSLFLFIWHSFFEGCF